MYGIFSTLSSSVLCTYGNPDGNDFELSFFLLPKKTNKSFLPHSLLINHLNGFFLNKFLCLCDIDLYLSPLLLLFLLLSSSTAYLTPNLSVKSVPTSTSPSSGNNESGIISPWEYTLHIFCVFTLYFLFSKKANLSSVFGTLLSISK